MSESDQRRQVIAATLIGHRPEELLFTHRGPDEVSCSCGKLLRGETAWGALAEHQADVIVRSIQ